MFGVLNSSNRSKRATERRQSQHRVNRLKSYYTCSTAKPFVCVQIEYFGVKVGERSLQTISGTIPGETRIETMQIRVYC